VFQLGDVLRFDSTVVINVGLLINISFPKSNNQTFQNFEAWSAWICFSVNLNTYGWIILQLQKQKLYRTKQSQNLKFLVKHLVELMILVFTLMNVFNLYEW